MVRTGHFIVFCTSAQQPARWAAREMETAYADMTSLVGQGTDLGQAHQRLGRQDRGRDTTVRALGVLLTDRPLSERELGTPWDVAPDLGTDLYVASRGDTAGLEKHLPAMRRKAFLTYLQLLGQDRVLPPWAREGLADYIAQPDGIAQPDSENMPADAAPQRGRGDARWVRFLLEGDDARYAPDFFTAMTAALARAATDPYSPFDWDEGVMRFGPPSATLGPATLGSSPVDVLMSRPDMQQRFSAWLDDPEAGRPIIEPISGDLPPDNVLPDERLKEMALILKLARRFPTQTTQPVQPVVRKFGEDLAEEAAVEDTSDEATASDKTPAETEETEEDGDDATSEEGLHGVVTAAMPHESISALYRRLTDATAPAWATRDADGRLLVSSNRRRLAAVFDNPDRHYRTYRQAGHLVLEAQFADGATYAAWWEENPEQPDGPLVRVQRKSHAIPPTVSQKAWGKVTGNVTGPRF